MPLDALVAFVTFPITIFFVGHVQLSSSDEVEVLQAYKIQLVLCAVGIMSMSFSSNRDGQPPGSQDSEGYRLGEAWFQASQMRIGMLLSSGGGLLEAQCFFFSGVYLMHVLRPVAAWSLFLQALASCQTYPCASNEDEEYYTIKPPEDREQQFRTQESMYWTCFKTEL